MALTKVTSIMIEGVAGAGRKNILINGGFDVWQRGTSLTTYGYIADRFRMSLYSGTVNSAQTISGLPAHYHAYRISNTLGVIEFEQRLEGQSIPDSAAELTLSFWIKGSKSGVVRTGRLINGNTGVTNSGYGNVNVTTSWAKVNVTVTGVPATPSQYYRLFVLDSLASYFDSTSVWLEITGVQLELGSVATDFEHSSYGEQLQLCKRYWRRDIYRTGILPWAGSAGGTAQATWPLNPEMRTAPTLSTNSTPTYSDITGTAGPNGQNGVTSNVNVTKGASKDRIHISNNATGATIYAVTADITADAEL